MTLQRKILILTEPEDLHALAIAWGISQLGHVPYLWFLPDFPSIQTISISSLHSNCAKIIITGLDIELDTRSITAVWKRGLFSPTIPRYLAKADHAFAKNECIHIFHSICAVLERQCSFWVNPLNADLINNKVNQLNIAQQLGLLIPATLISNNPSEIRTFFHSFDRNIIHKSFSPMGWKYKANIYAGATNKVTLEDLQDDRVLSACPGIYQHYIDKKIEVRVTIIGEDFFQLNLTRNHVKKQ